MTAKERPALAGPEDTAASLWAKIPRHIKITFFAACLSGLIAHLYMFTRKLPNLDDIGALFASDYGTASGRWMLPLLSNLDGQLSTPWLLGLLSILLVAVAACLTVSVMRIRRPLGCVLTAALLATYPTFTATLFYMFSADAYILALALACFAAYLTNKYRFGFLGGIAAITLSMGIYQSYFGVAAVLLVGVLLLDTLDGKLPIKKLLAKGVKFVLTLGLGLLLYMLVVKITTYATGLVDYMGLSQMGKISLAELPGQIAKAYLEYGNFFIQNDPAAHLPIMKYLFVLVAAAVAVLGVLIVRRRKLKAPHIALALLLAVLFPLAGNIIYVMVPMGTVHTLMLYGMVFVLISPLALVEYHAALPPAKGKGAGKTLSALCAWVIVGALSLTAYGYTIFSNEIYLKVDLSNMQIQAFSARLLGAIEGVDGYTAELPVVLVGQALQNVPYPPTPELDAITLTGAAGTEQLINSYTYGYYLRRFSGASNIIYGSSTDPAKAFGALDEVQAMPAYPAVGGIAIIDDHIVVKFS